MLSFKKGLSNLFGCHLVIVKVVHYFHLTMQRWYSKQWNSATRVRVEALSFVHNLNQWTDKSLVITWLSVTTVVTALRPLYQSWDAYNNHNNLPLLARATPPPPSTNQVTPPPPHQTANNQNRNNWVIGEAPLVKNIWLGCNFVGTI